MNLYVYECITTIITIEYPFQHNSWLAVIALSFRHVDILFLNSDEKSPIIYCKINEFHSIELNWFDSIGKHVDLLSICSRLCGLCLLHFRLSNDYDYDFKSNFSLNERFIYMSFIWFEWWQNISTYWFQLCCQPSQWLMNITWNPHEKWNTPMRHHSDEKVMEIKQQVNAHSEHYFHVPFQKKNVPATVNTNRIGDCAFWSNKFWWRDRQRSTIK